jgi:malate permease and related proteins
VAGIGVIWAVIGLFSACGAPIPPEIRAVVVLIGLLPVAGNIVIFAAQLQGDVAASALIVAVSTTVSTVGILIWSVMLLGL